MNSKALFGRYWDAQSAIHSLDPRTKLIGTFAMIVIVFLAGNWLALGFAALCILGMFLIAHIPLGQALRSIAPIAFVAVLAMLANVLFLEGGEILFEWGPIRITSHGLDTGAFVGVRLILLLLVGSLLTMTTTTMDITEATERLLSPLGKIGLPVHEFAFVVGTALRFLPQFADEFQTIRAAQITRGAKLATSPTRGLASLSSMVVPMFSSVFRHADTLSDAMDARCYHGAGGRTRLHPLRFARRDACAAVAMVAICVCVILISRV